MMSWGLGSNLNERQNDECGEYHDSNDLCHAARSIEPDGDAIMTAIDQIGNDDQEGK